jgi:hypothetical protein
MKVGSLLRQNVSAHHIYSSSENYFDFCNLKFSQYNPSGEIERKCCRLFRNTQFSKYYKTNITFLENWGTEDG